MRARPLTQSGGIWTRHKRAHTHTHTAAASVSGQECDAKSAAAAAAAVCVFVCPPLSPITTGCLRRQRSRRWQPVVRLKKNWPLTLCSFAPVSVPRVGCSSNNNNSNDSNNNNRRQVSSTSTCESCRARTTAHGQRLRALSLDICALTAAERVNADAAAAAAANWRARKCENQPGGSLSAR